MRLASAVTRSAVASDSLLMTSPTPMMISAYQAMAIITDRIRAVPISRWGRSISSAACGMMSKPTNIKGTMTSTIVIPVTPSANSGSRLETEPVTPAPLTKKKPTIRISSTTMVWTMATNLTPITFGVVMMTAPAIPVATQVA